MCIRDRSPSLYAVQEDWHHVEAEIDYNAARDVSDYLTMAYCLDHDIPILGFCRGSQMLGVVSGATMIQDLPVWFASHNLDYNYEHRREISEGERIFTKLVNSSPSTLQVIVTLWVTAVIHFKALVTHSSPESL